MKSPTPIDALAERVFGSEAAARAWLDAPNPALSHAVPSRMLHAEAGRRQVEQVLTRIEYGVYE